MSWIVTTVGSTFTNGAVPTPWWTTSRCRRRAIAASQVCSAAILKGRRLELQGASTTSATVSISGCPARKPCIATTTRSWPQVPTARTRLVSSASDPPTSPGSRKSRFTPMRMAKNNTSPHEDRLRRRPRAEPPHGGRPVRRRLARGPAGRRPRARGLAVRRGAPAGAGHHDGGIRPFGGRLGRRTGDAAPAADPRPPRRAGLGTGPVSQGGGALRPGRRGARHQLLGPAARPPQRGRDRPRPHLPPVPGVLHPAGAAVPLDLAAGAEALCRRADPLRDRGGAGELRA